MRKYLAVFMLFAVCAFFIYQTGKAMSVVSTQAKILEIKGTVVIDAGHGGEDGGAVGVNGIVEKDINLKIAQELRNILVLQNFEVIMIRDADESVGDNSLSTIAERKRSDTKKRLQTVQEIGECILISIHQNFFDKSKYSGALVIYSGNRPESAALASSIRKNIIESTQPENKRETLEAGKNIYLMHKAQVPAVLVECGFITNHADAEKLSQEGYQKQLAVAIYEGIIDYLIGDEDLTSESGASELS